MNTSEMIQVFQEVQRALESQEEMKRTNVLLGSEIRGLKEELARRDEKASELREELGRRERTIADNQQVIDLQRTEIEGLRQELQERATQTEGLNVSLAAIHTELLKKELQTELARKALDDTYKELRETREALNMAAGERDKARMQLSEVQSERSGIEERYAEKLAILEKELADARAIEEQYAEKLAGVEQDLEEAHTTLRGARDALAKALNCNPAAEFSVIFTATLNEIEAFRTVQEMVCKYLGRNPKANTWYNLLLAIEDLAKTRGITYQRGYTDGFQGAVDQFVTRMNAVLSAMGLPTLDRKALEKADGEGADGSR